MVLGIVIQKCSFAFALSGSVRLNLFYDIGGTVAAVSLNGLKTVLSSVDCGQVLVLTINASSYLGQFMGVTPSML